MLFVRARGFGASFRKRPLAPAQRHRASRPWSDPWADGRENRRSGGVVQRFGVCPPHAIGHVFQRPKKWLDGGNAWSSENGSSAIPICASSRAARQHLPSLRESGRWSLSFLPEACLAAATPTLILAAADPIRVVPLTVALEEFSRLIRNLQVLSGVLPMTLSRFGLLCAAITAIVGCSSDGSSPILRFRRSPAYATSMP